ncbi:MAG: hypothetical protein ACTSWQ_10265, partial [Candidatus Thorarchaeota archaeon]
MSSLKEDYLKFIQIEDKLGLFQKKMGGIRFWELARAEVFLTLFEHKVSGVRQMPSISKILDKFLFYFRSLFDLRRNPFFCNEKD